MKKSLLYALVAVVFMAAGCSPSEGAPELQVQVQQPDNQPAQTQTAPQAKIENEPNYISVTQAVQGSNLNSPSYRIAENTTALVLLKMGHKVETKDYGSLGEMVTGIDGNSAKLNQFWAFYVNGKLADVGAGAYRLKDGDKIEWKLNDASSYQPNSK